MLETPEAVLDALRENDDRPYGLHRTVTAEELAEAAEAFEDAGLLVTALLELMAAYEFTGEHRKSPVVFARLLKLHESTPDAFSEWAEHQIHWRFKWVTTSLLQVPDMPLTTVHGWIDRMRERYEDAGHGLQPVAAMRCWPRSSACSTPRSTASPRSSPRRTSTSASRSTCPS
ncbi:hypothetical protein ACWGMU_02785, partial [Streptomyces diastaticus]